MMVQAQLNISTTTVMSAMVAIGLVGLAIDVALRALEAAVRLRGLA
jgi:NitT/TauT family transport system permease protein